MTGKKPEIAVIAALPDYLRSALAQRFTLVDHLLEGDAARRLSDIPPHCRVIVTRAVLGVPSGLDNALPELGLVLSMGAGLEQIDVAALERRGVAVVHTPDQFTEDVADFAIGLLFSAQRDIARADRFVRTGTWETARFRTSRRVSNRRVGIVGFGRIGRRVAEKCAALGMPVAYYSRHERTEQPFPFHRRIGDLAKASDILVLACAGTEETRHLVDQDVLAALGPDGILVNVSRGSVVDEAALLDALEQNRLGAAALDVFAAEPHIDPRFLRLENVVLSPHAASFTHEAQMAIADHLVRAAEDFFQPGRRDD